ncbi:MAG: Mur ligase domain-containing protein, partial [Defluviitaleaceae bacterium]|nr:Mur ligase domain-containing protein [Defluviitaleaceae bacterium]
MPNKETLPDWYAQTLAGVSTDTRDDLAGKLFIAIKGERFDGHDFIPQAFAGGAAACLSENPPGEAGAQCAPLRENLPDDGKYTDENRTIYVPSTMKAMQDLAAYYKSLFTVK